MAEICKQMDWNEVTEEQVEAEIERVEVREDGVVITKSMAKFTA